MTPLEEAVLLLLETGEAESQRGGWLVGLQGLTWSGGVDLCICKKEEARSASAPSCCCLVANSSQQFRDPLDCILPGSSVGEILQATILDWVTFPSPGNIADPGIKPASSALGEFCTL